MKAITKAQQLHKVKKINPKKVSNSELKQRVQFLLNKEICQICNKARELDYPHHAEFGNAKKHDFSMINICVSCHRYIHTKGFPVCGLTREDTITIGKMNNEEFLNETR